MKIGNKYEIVFPNGDTTTVKLICEKYDTYKFEYLEDETRKPVTPIDNMFHFPVLYTNLLKIKEL